MNFDEMFSQEHLPFDFAAWKKDNETNAGMKDLSDCIDALSTFNVGALKKLVADGKDDFIKIWGIPPRAAAALASILYTDLREWLGAGKWELFVFFFDDV